MIGHGKFTSLRPARGHLYRGRSILPALHARIPVRAVLPYGEAGGGGGCSTVVGTGKDLTKMHFELLQIVPVVVIVGGSWLANRHVAGPKSKNLLNGELMYPEDEEKR